MVDLEKLKEFLKNPAANPYTSGAKEIAPQRPGYKELEAKQGDWYLRDSYAGYYQAPGMATVYFRGEPVWTIAYGGKMHEDKYAVTEETFAFLRRALSQKNRKLADDLPVRGPSEYAEGEFRYSFSSEGDLRCFYGRERIFYKGEEVFYQDVIGGLIIDKTDNQQLTTDNGSVQKESRDIGEQKISYEEFAKVKLRTAKVLAAEPVEGSTKLVRLDIETEGGPRQIVAGIGEWYKSENLVGKTIIVVANLKPKKLKGLESNGMLLAADVNGQPILLMPDKETPPGAIVK